MARVTGSCTGGWGSKYSYYLDYTLNSQSVANNTSNITLTAWAQASASNYQANNSSTTANTYRVYVNGTNKVSGAKAMDFRNRAVVSLGSWTGDVGHNSDGTLTINIGGAFTISGTSSLSGGSVSANWTLPTIARASIPTLSVGDVNIGSPTTLYTNRASSSFSHTIEYFFGNASGVIATGVELSFAWTLPNDLAYQIPSANSGNGTLRLWTYNGGTTIGYKDVHFTAYVPTESSTFNPTATGLTIGISGNGRDKAIGKFVQGISRADISFTPTTRMGAWVSSTNIHIGRWYNGSSITSDPLSPSGALGITAQVIDSRGRVAEAYGSITLEPYSPPKITLFNALRITGTGTTSAVVSQTGTFSYMGGSNPLATTIQRQEVGTSTWITLQNKAGNINGTFDDSLNVTGLSDAKSYLFRLTVSDSFGGGGTSNASVSTAPTSFTQGKTGIGAGKVWEQGALDIGGEAFLDGMSLNKTNNLPSGDGSLAYWHSLKTGTYFANPSTFTGQPSEYGILVFYRNTLSGACDFSAIWHTQSTGSIYRLSGNSSTIGDWTEMSSSALNAYPVGAIYMSTVSTSPSSLFGGTWVALYDRFLIGGGSGYSNGSTGGESVHTLTNNEMPSHDHGLHNNNTNSTVRGFGTTDTTVYATSARTQSAGGGGAHNNMPPYLAVYMWKRTA